MRKVEGYGKYFHGKENAQTRDHLLAGEPCVVIGIGQSMTPILKSGQPVFVVPLEGDMPLERNDIVFCKVNGHFYQDFRSRTSSFRWMGTERLTFI